MRRGPGLSTLVRHLWRDGATLSRTFMNLALADIPVLAGTVLDVGAGEHPSYWNFVSLAPGARLLTLDRVAGNHPHVVADIERGLPFRDGTIDTTLLFNVLEHIFDHRRVIREIGRVLRPNGVLYVAVPFLVAVHTKAEPQFFVDDFFRYSRSGLVRLLAEEGRFDEVEVMEQGGLFLSVANLLQPALKLRAVWIPAVCLAYLLDLLADRRFPPNREKWVMGYVVTARKAG